MKAILSAMVFTMVTAVGVLAAAKENVSNDISASNSDLKVLTPEDLSWRFHVSGEVLVTTREGDKLVGLANETREWKYGGDLQKPLESNWRFEQKGLPRLALRHIWTVEKDGKISVEITQYDDLERVEGSDVKYGKVIKQDKFILKNFAPIDWVLDAGVNKMIVRLTPGVWANDDAIDLAVVPISGKNIVVFDKAGKLWADQVTTDRPATYFGVTTHQGSVFLSFSKFAGAKLIGEAKGGRIRVKDGNAAVILQSETPFVPQGVKANVYGIINRQKRTERLNSVRTMSSDQESQFLKAVGGN